MALHHPGCPSPIYRAALIQIGSGERARTRLVTSSLDHVWVKLGYQLFRIFDLTNAAIKLSAFGNREFLITAASRKRRRSRTSRSFRRFASDYKRSGDGGQTQ